MNSKWKILGLLVALVGVLGLAIWALPSLRGRVAYRVESTANLARAMWHGRSISQDGDFTNVIFLHHSTGGNLIREGGVRERFSEAGYDFWDHGYNGEGLTRPDGTSAGYHYHIPNDNTDPDGFALLFSQPLYDRPRNAFSGLMQHEVIIFKSCFPVSQITSDAQLAQYKRYYLQIRGVMDQHPDHIFVVVTPPPLTPAVTDAEAAARARAFADWLGSEEFVAGHPNVFTFDLFDHLAEPDPDAPDYSMLRAEYRRGGEDSHPNQLANETIGPVFVDSVIEVVRSYRSERGIE